MRAGMQQQYLYVLCCPVYAVSRYVSGDFRFRNGYCRSNPRKMVKTWAEKEMRNLARLRAAGIPAPAPLLLRMHVLVMEFIGDDGVAAPRLKVGTVFWGGACWWGGGGFNPCAWGEQGGIGAGNQLRNLARLRAAGIPAPTPKSLLKTMGSLHHT